MAPHALEVDAASVEGKKPLYVLLVLWPPSYGFEDDQILGLSDRDSHPSEQLHVGRGERFDLEWKPRARDVYVYT